ncbi:MAG: MBL fold metallo-hydrolase [Isosphaeraceae bacterium]
MRIRMYRQGLGDCFLLTFPRTEGGDYHVLIDCGVIVGTANAVTIMKEVVDDIARTTSKRVDLLIVTHEHWDHISGFDPSARLFEGFTFLEVWLGWTEDPQDRVATWLRAERAQRLSALQLGFTKLASLFGQRGATAEELEVVERSRGVLGFFGIDEDSRPETRPARGKAANEGLPSENRCGRTMRWLREESSRNVKYRRPGEEVVLTRASGVRVFVLGPPTDLSLLRKDLPTRSGRNPAIGVSWAWRNRLLRRNRSGGRARHRVRGIATVRSEIPNRLRGRPERRVLPGSLLRLGTRRRVGHAASDQ